MWILKLKQINQNKDYSYILSNIVRIHTINEIADKKFGILRFIFIFKNADLFNQ